MKFSHKFASNHTFTKILNKYHANIYYIISVENGSENKSMANKM